jgi:hypothetical protein
VDSTHNAFVFPLMPSINHALISFLGDCVNGDDQCTGLPGVVSGADIDPDGHGTSSAAIVIGYPTSEGCEQGVAPGSMDSYKVYSTTSCSPGCSGVCLVHSAVLKGLQQALNRLDTVVIAEMQAWGPVDGDIANAADQVFNTGAMVIAAQGNFDGCSSCSSTPPCILDCKVKSPANAHYAISAGGWDIKDLVLLPAPVPISMSCGPTDDGRVKPDVLAPTGTWVAGDHSNFDLHAFPGTSGATPYVAGAAGLIHGSLAGTMTDFGHDPGMTYAWLIAAGRDTWTEQATGASQTTFAPKRGAGPIELPPPSLGMMGKVGVVAGQIVPFTIDLTGSSVTRIEAALWWADPREPGIGSYGHCRIDLELGLPGQPAAVASRHPTGVFQRATATILPSMRGVWELRVVGADIPSWVPSQNVYLVALWR